MSRIFLSFFIVSALLFPVLNASDNTVESRTSSTGKYAFTSSPPPNLPSRPLIPRRGPKTYTTVLTIDGAGLRGLIPALVLLEFEQSIKRHLLTHQEYLLNGGNFTSIDEFDVNLVDYFDLMSGISSGSWSVLYLASRGGKGFARGVLDSAEVVERYGQIQDGGAAALQVFFKEYGGVIYPQNPNSLPDLSIELVNPESPGVLAPRYNNEGIEQVLTAFIGNLTLTDLETTVLVPVWDLVSGQTILFAKNTFRDPPTVGALRFLPIAAPRDGSGPTPPLFPNLAFQEDRDYYLKDIGTAAAAVPVFNPAQNMTPVNGQEPEFVLIDGGLPLPNMALASIFYSANEKGLPNFEQIALVSLSNGVPFGDLSPLANAGAAGWLENAVLLISILGANQEVESGLVDYLYYANSRIKQGQYLRIQTARSVMTEEGVALSALDQPGFLGVYEEIGMSVVEQYRASIDSFVNDFVFG